MGLSCGVLPGFQFIGQHMPLAGELGITASHVAPCRVRQTLGLCRHLAALLDPLGWCSSPKIFRRKVVVHFASSEALQYPKRVMAILVTPESKIHLIGSPRRLGYRATAEVQNARGDRCAPDDAVPSCGGSASSMRSRLASAAVMRLEAMLSQRLASISHSADTFSFEAEAAMLLHSSACAL